MAHDGSIASKVEDWIISQVLAITIEGQGGPEAIFETSEVLPWVGTNAGSIEAFAKEIMQASRPRIARVFWALDRQVEELADDQARVFGQYWVLVGIRDMSNAAVARRGLVRGTTLDFGTNLMRDLLRGALDQKRPNLSANGHYVDLTRYKGASVAHMADNLCVMKAVVETEEVPTA